MKQILRYLLFFGLITTVFPGGALFATHTVGGEITYECLGNNRYRFTIVFYRDCASSVGLSTPTLRITSASCGQTVNGSVSLISGPTAVTPTNTRSSCTGAIVNACQEQFVYQSTVTLPPCPDWEIFSGLACCRNAPTNIPSGGSVSQGVGAFLNNAAAANGAAFCNSTPVFYGSSAHVLCTNTDYILDPGIVELEGDSLAFKLIAPRANNGATIAYTNPYTVANPLPSTPIMNLDVNTGQVTIRPTAQGDYVFALEVEEWRNGVLIGKSSREFQISPVPCPVQNTPPVILRPTSVTGGILFGNRIDVCPGDTLSFEVPAIDFDTGDSLFMRDSLGVNWGTVTPFGQGDSITARFNGIAPATPGIYPLVLVVRDNGCPIYAEGPRTFVINVADGTSITGSAVRFACSNGSNPAILNAFGGSTFTWSVVSGDMNSLNGVNVNAPSITVNPTISTRYTVTTNFVCRAPPDTVTVNVVDPPGTITTGAVVAPNTLCGIQNVNVSVTPRGGSGGPFSYSWAPANTVANPNDSATVVTPTDTTDYIISVFDPASGCTAFDTVRINVSAPYLAMNPVVTQQTYCPGDTPVALISNAEAGNCEAYSVRSIPHSPVATVPPPPVGPGPGTFIVLGLGSTQGPVPIGFDFPFYCDTVTSFYASSGGWIGFANPSGNAYTGARAIPAAAAPNNLIAFLGGDFVFNPFGGSFFYYEVQGTAPNRVGLLTLINGLSFSNNSNQNSLQVKLFETTGDIEIHISRANTGANSTVGIENATGNLGIAAPGRNNQAFTIGAGQEEAWRFSFDKGDPWTVAWYEQPFPPGQLVGTGDTAYVTPNAVTSYCAVITDQASNCKDTICPPTTVSTATLNAVGPAGPLLIGATPTIDATYTGQILFNCNGYKVPSIPFGPEALAGATTLTMGDDDTQGPFYLGFTMDWYCGPVDSIWINSNGWLTFSNPGGANGALFASLPNAFSPNDLVSFIGADLEPNAGGTIRYATAGVAPSRKFIVDFSNVPYYASSNTVSVQVVLHEATGNIDVHSRNIDVEPFNNIVQAVQRNGTVGIGAPGRNYAALGSALTNDGLRFRPDTSNLSYRWTSSLGPGILQDSTVEDPTTVPLPASAGLVCFYVEADNGSCLLYDTVCVPLSVLPLRELLLEARPSGNTVHLNWSASGNAEVDRYLLEHALPGRPFQPLDAVIPGGLSHYSYVHEDPAPGINRYRLKAFDMEGTYSHSNAVEAFIGPLNAHRVAVFPNPGSGVFSLSYHINGPASVEISVTDLQGRNCYRSAVAHEQAGSYQKHMDLTELTPGVYLYQVHINGKRLAGKLQIQR